MLLVVAAVVSAMCESNFCKAKKVLGKRLLLLRALFVVDGARVWATCCLGDMFDEKRVRGA